MNLYAFTDLRKMQLLSVQSMIAVEELIIRQYEPASPSDGQRAVDHSISASPITGRSLVFGPDVKRERSESRSDAEGALDSRAEDQILEKRGGRALE